MLQRRLQAVAAFWVCAALLCLTTPRAIPVPGAWAADVLRPLVTPASVLPAGLAPPGADGRLLVSVIAADIDADGDLDVVGSDGSLNLIVWDNDGTGHLTRKDPQRPATGGWESSSGTTVDDRPATSTVAAQFGGTSIPLTASAPSFNSRPSPWSLAPSAPHSQPQFASTRIPRAPPAPSLFV